MNKHKVSSFSAAVHVLAQTDGMCEQSAYVKSRTIIEANEETKKLLQNMNMILCSLIPFPAEWNHFIFKKTPTQTSKR